MISDDLPRELDQLGFTSVEMRTLEKLVDRPQGLILAAGPAGSGKTTTLNALLLRLFEIRKVKGSFKPDLVATVEDPVEYPIPHFHQTSIQPKLGMTFAQGLRAILAQDFQVVLVGEVRDRETAQAVVKAALSGHLVFSSLHNNSAIGVVLRFFDMGVEPSQLSAALSGIICQRLVRRLCPACDESPLSKGCENCNNSGYSGRIAVPEILEITGELKNLILEKASLEELRSHILSSGHVSLWESAQERVKERMTSAAEVERVVERETLEGLF